MQSSIETFRTKVIYKSLDAAVTAPLRPRQDRQDYLAAIFNGRTSNYDRVAAWTNLVDSFIPGFSRRVSGALTNTSRFPLAGSEIELMSYGSGSTVFLLRRPERDWVLKVYRRSLGKKNRSLDEITQHFKEKYETVCSWYNGRFNLVPPAHYLILYGPIFSSPAAAVLQEYIHGEKSDFFMDYSNEELIDLMELDEELKCRFLFFAEQTLELYEKHNLCVDFLGRENLMLVKNNGRRQLLVVDNGIFNVDDFRHSAPLVYSHIHSRLDRLHYLKRVME